ncbi:facilitated trehalose transporter Tret1-like isoform X2 [Sitodiplosis mosellana]|uniref:facilitated trehalose transporter Tret1-like isoform X2 n=1 Tax=Sitodiplosis mosellana TaxID=263140 RepID=UPI00244384AE|nr:facilitated trehalose transporter Tret1-like isoform X2 [Sitodiplosis mosellana]
MATIEVRRQFFSAISANFIGFSFGWACAWANVNFLELQSPNTKLQDGPISYDEASLVMSLICAGGLMGNIVYLWALDKFGRKKPIMFLAFPTILSWTFIIFAKNAYWLYISRVLCGFIGGGLFISIPIFVSEICSDSSLGSLVGFTVAIFLDFQMQAVSALSVPILFAFVFYFVPESPMILYKKNEIELADMSLEFYKGVTTTPELEKFMTEKKTPKDNGLSISDFVGTRSTRRAVSIALFLVFLPQFCGCYILLSYTTPFFAEAGSSLTPIQSSILICVVQLLANFLTMFLIDRIGRRILFTLSSIGAGVGMLVLALHRLYKDELPESNWIPMYGLSITIFIASIGLIPVPFIITIDVLPPKIRNTTMTITSMIMWVLGFSTNIAYLYLLQIIKLHGCLLVFSAGCFACAMYALIFIPETKGKSPESVEKLLES